MVLGIDVSDYQASVDWPTVASAGYKFAFTKATQGTTFVAKTFETNWAGIKKAGMIRGAYHYVSGDQDPIKQAQFFWRTMQAAGYGTGDLPLVLDVEDPNHQVTSNMVISFVTELEKMSKHTPIIYTGAFYYKGPTLDCPLWLPSYFTGRPVDQVLHDIKPPLPPAWRNWTFWQYSDKGTVPGVTGDVDVNIYAGEMTDLIKFVGGMVKPNKVALTTRLIGAGFGPKSVVQVLKALADWNGEILPPRPEDSDLFRRLVHAGFGPDSARKIIFALR